MKPDAVIMRWHAVTTEFYDNGKVYAFMTSGICYDKLPDNHYEHKFDKDIYIDYFGNREDAIKFCDEAIRA